MSQRILVAYASRAGSTAEVAETIGEVLRESELDVDVRCVKNLQGVTGYDALVLGSAIWAGKPLPEMLRFVSDQRDAITRLPVAYFILCDLLRAYTPANRQVALGYLAPLRKLHEPVSAGMFAGRRDFSKMHPVLAWMLMKIFHLAEGDWRNWEQIRAWAATLVPQLTGVEPAHVASDAA